MRRLVLDDVDVIEHVLSVRTLVDLALRERARPLPAVKQAHPLIIAPTPPKVGSSTVEEADLEPSEAERLHAAACEVAPRLSTALEGARFERRPGYVWMVCPQVPIPSFNSVWAEDDSCAPALADAVSEIVSLGLPASVLMRRDRTPACEEAAAHIGLMLLEEIPAMLAGPDEVRGPDLPDLEVIHVTTADGLAQALAVAADGFDAPPEIFAPLYDFDVARLDGLEYYVGRVGNADVTTAVGFTIGNAVGIFNVATLAPYRGRGYGAAITAQAAGEGFRAGAEFAWLQSSAVGHSVYRRLGFRDVETYLLWTAPEAVAEAPEGLV